MSLCSIALEKCTARPLWDDIDNLYVGTEGFFGDVWRKIKEFFKNLWHWIRDTWYKLLEFLGIRKKSIESNQKEIDRLREAADESMKSMRKAAHTESLSELAENLKGIRDSVRDIEFMFNISKKDENGKIKPYTTCMDISKFIKNYRNLNNAIDGIANGFYTFLNKFKDGNAIKSMKKDTDILSGSSDIAEFSNKSELEKFKNNEFVVLNLITPQNNEFMKNNAISNYVVNKHETIKKCNELTKDEVQINTYDQLRNYTQQLDMLAKEYRSSNLQDRVYFSSISTMQASERSIDSMLKAIENEANESDNPENYKKYINGCRCIAYVYKANAESLYSCMNISRYFINKLYTAQQDMIKIMTRLNKKMKEIKEKYSKKLSEERKSFDEQMKGDGPIII